MSTNFMKVRNGVALTPQSGPTSSPSNGDMYYDSTIGTFVYYDNGHWINMASRADVASATTITSTTLTATVVQNSFLRITGTTAGALCGLSASSPAKQVIVYNQTNTTLTIKYQSATETIPQNRIITATLADIVLTSGQTAFLLYDDSQQAWVVVSTAGGDVALSFDIADGFQYAIGDFFLVPDTNPTSYVDATNTTASYVTATNAAAGTYRMLCDKTKTLTTSGASFTLSTAPNFTLTVGCILWSNSQQTWRKIASLTSQTTGILDASFNGNLTSDGCMVSQAMFTEDLTALGDAAHKQRGIDIFPSTTISNINVSYQDSIALGDGEFNPVQTAAVVLSASNSGTAGATGLPASSTFSAPYVRPSAPALYPNYSLTVNSTSQRLFLVFFPNPNNSAITTGSNVIQYIASLYATHLLNTGGYLNSAFTMTDGSGTSVDASAAVSGGFTQISTTWSYVPGLNTGLPDGDLEVIIEGNVIPRYYTGVVGQYYTEVDPYTIQLSSNYSHLSYSVHIRRRQGSIDTSDTNAAFIFKLTGVMFPFAGSAAPGGFLLCDGSAVNRATYSALFATIGTTYGVGDGSTTFNLPNTQGVFLRGAGSQAISGITYTGTLGAAQNDAMQGHQHTTNANTMIFQGTSTNGYSFPGNGFALSAAAENTSDPVNDGSNGNPRYTSETRPANLGVNYIIKY